MKLAKNDSLIHIIKIKMYKKQDFTENYKESPYDLPNQTHQQVHAKKIPAS